MKVGDKVIGFRFQDGIDGIGWGGRMNDYVGKNGVIKAIYEDFFQIQFDDDYWSYPLSLSHLAYGIAPQTDSIVESVINQFKQRSEVGINKYGTTLDRNDLSTLEWIKEAQQEAMDFVLYLEKLKQELK